MKKISKENEELSQKLNRLTDCLLDQGISRDAYRKKHDEITYKQQEVMKQMELHQSSNNELKKALCSLMILASRASDIFESSKTSIKRKLISFVFTNLKLHGEKLDISMRRPLNILLNISSIQDWRPLRKPRMQSNLLIWNHNSLSTFSVTPNLTPRKYVLWWFSVRCCENVIEGFCPYSNSRSKV